MRKLYRTIRKVAGTEATVLLVGESGTGKELAAQTIHEMSGLTGPFVAMNCGAISAELAESELFGHEKGSFSGAHKQHAGYFERAEGGTLLLDEIGEMSMDLQVKLLRVLETRKYRRVGGTQDIAMSVRFISATNREPEAAIQEGLLREDLYFRIAQFVLKMPPLRSRGKDITGLAQFMLNELNEINGTAKYFSEESQSAILGYPWPGNVRELKSAIERAYIMADQQLQNEHFPDGQIDLHEPGDYLGVSVGESLEHTERKQIIATLEALDGDKKAAADSLGISLKTLYNRLNEYDNPEATPSETPE
jgi:DNA-binding NtrC family response regulator